MSKKADRTPKININVFDALSMDKKKSKKAAKADAATGASDPKAVFAFVNQKSTSAWGDDSDDEAEHAVVAEQVQEQAAAEEVEEDDSEEDSDEDSDEEEEEPKKEVAAPAAPVKKAPAPRTLSKKEQKQKEAEEFEAALAALGISTDAPVKEEKKPEAAPETPANGESASKKKKKNGKKKPAADAKPAETEEPVIVDIKSVVKAKGGKKKKTENSAVRIAREEALKAKAKKKNRDKATFNEFSI